MHLNQHELLAKIEDSYAQLNWQRAIQELFAEVPGHDLSTALLEMPEQQVLRILDPLDPAQVAELLQFMEYADQYRFLDHMELTAARQVLDEMPSDALVDLIGALHPKQAQQLLGLLDQDRVTLVNQLMTYPPNTAGGLMTDGYVAVLQHMSVADVLRHVRKVGADAETVTYIYVVDKSGRLTGVVSLRELVLRDPDSRVADFMTSSVVTVPADLDQEDVAEVVAAYDFVAVPVVSRENRLMGIITVDDVIDVIAEEASEDVYRFAATGAPESAPGQRAPSIWALARPRLPWLVSLLFLELGSGYIVNSFSNVVAPSVAVLLALFTVVMAGESGNAATQALAVTVRGLAIGEIETTDMLRVVGREALVGLLVGVITGATLAAVAYVWQRNVWFSAAVGLALVANLFIAKVLGGLFPIIMEKLGVDPAVASGPFITTLTDNTSVLIYYAITAWLLSTTI